MRLYQIRNGMCVWDSYMKQGHIHRYSRKMCPFAFFRTQSLAPLGIQPLSFIGLFPLVQKRIRIERVLD